MGGEEKGQRGGLWSGEGGHAGSWCDNGRCGGQSEMEMDDPLWRPLTGAPKRRRRRFVFNALYILLFWDGFNPSMLLNCFHTCFT